MGKREQLEAILRGVPLFDSNTMSSRAPALWMSHCRDNPEWQLDIEPKRLKR